MNIWIQKHDFSAEDLDVADAAEAIARLRAFDWSAEIEKMQEKSGDSCDPGFGVVLDDGHILHLLPDGKGSAMVLFDYPEEAKLFGLWKHTRTRSKQKEAVSIDEAATLVEFMFAGEPDKVRDWI